MCYRVEKLDRQVTNTSTDPKMINSAKKAKIEDQVRSMSPHEDKTIKIVFEITSES